MASKIKTRWKESDSTFINPYNFIELSGKCKKINNSIENRKINKYNNNERLITGVIGCTLITKTPIFIPDSNNVKEEVVNKEEHKVYDFFSYDNEKEKTENPIIPGSSIRGVIRSSYEAVTNSCFSVIDDERVLYKRMPDSGNPGMLVRDNEVIYLCDCRKIRLQIEKKNIGREKKIIKELTELKDGDILWIKPNCQKVRITDKNKVSKTEIQGYIKTILIKGGESSNKKNYSCFPVNVKLTKDRVITESDISNLRKVISLYKNENINQDIEKGTHDGFVFFEENFENFISCKQDKLPIYYKVIDGKYYLSPSCITKEVYNNKIKDILERDGQFEPCNNVNKLCDACDLFGMVNEKKAVSSKLRFTDARLEEGQINIFHDYITLDELSSPKISATEFYMCKPEEKSSIWTYDYSANWKKRIKIASGASKITIRGRKFYWNNKRFRFNESVKNKRNSTIRPINTDIKFNFNIFVERVKEDELKKLLWILAIGDNNIKSDLYHKIGMAKPLGYGSVKIIVNKFVERKIDVTSENIYSLVDRKNYVDNINKYSNEFEDKKIKEIKVATDINKPNGIIRYPYAIPIQGIDKGKESIFSWFIANKQINGGTGIAPKINFVLPKSTDNNINLRAYEEEEYEYEYEYGSNKWRKK